MPPPVVLLSRVDAGRGVLCDEVQHVVVDVVVRVPGVAVCIHAPPVPVLGGALLAVGDPSSIGVRVQPVSADLLLYGVGYAIAVSVQWIEVVCGVVLGIGAVDILLAVAHTTVVGVGDVPHRVVSVQSPIATHTEDQGASSGILEVVVQPVAVTIQKIVAGDAWIGVIQYLIQVVDAISVGVGHVRQ